MSLLKNLSFNLQNFTMSLNKESVLNATNNGLNVFKHFLGSKFSKVGKSFKSPFYQDNKASCYVYFDKKSSIYKFKAFGDAIAPRERGRCMGILDHIMRRFFS